MNFHHLPDTTLAHIPWIAEIRGWVHYGYLQNRDHQEEKIFMSDSEIFAERMLRPGLAGLSKAAAITVAQFIGREAQ